jgi:CHAT domain-containing protein
MSDCPLPAATREVSDIAKLWTAEASDSHEAIDDVLVLSGRIATKRAVTRAVTGRRIVHLATHSFFLRSTCEAGVPSTRAVGGLVPESAIAAVPATNPLLLSGLAFAGANRWGRARSDPADAILTAEEVAGMNLQGTAWAVLSACETAVGEVKAGEGVFGLRRAFQIAGARSIIMSLWSVEDEATRQWMRTLYEGRLRDHLSTADAVHQADLRTLHHRRLHHQSTHPFYWAAFVAAGDWR